MHMRAHEWGKGGLRMLSMRMGGGWTGEHGRRMDRRAWEEDELQER